MDAGWLVVTILHDGCDWETRLPQVALLYSKLTTYSTMSVTGKSTKDVKISAVMILS